MLNVTTVLTSIVSEQTAAHFHALYPTAPSGYLDLAMVAAETALDAIGRSDALYHNVEHTAHVTLVGLEVLKGKQEQEGVVTPSTWSNTVVALLCHDIGYVRGLCRGDTATTLSTGSNGQSFAVEPGASDAVLMPLHVNRGKCFIEEQFIATKLADIGFINACIERTRFPVPPDPWYAQTADYPGLVRAADLIGQLSDPRYLRKLAAIYFEFAETGFNDAMGYACPGDLLTAYPAFFEQNVCPYIGAAVAYLERVEQGREILDHLYRNLAAARAGAEIDLRIAANN